MLFKVWTACIYCLNLAIGEQVPCSLHFNLFPHVCLFLSWQLISASSLPLTCINFTTSISPVWRYLLWLTSLSPAAPAAVPEGAGGVRVVCRAIRAADRIQTCCWISTCFCQSPENSHWATNISICITPRLPRPACTLSLVAFQQHFHDLQRLAKCSHL